MSAICAYKVAAGSDTFSVDTNGTTTLQWAVAEYSGLATSSVLDQSAENESNDGSATTSCATGTTASLGSADRFAISAWAFDTGNGWNSGRSYTNGSSEAVFRNGAAYPGVCIADLQLSSSSGFSETISTTDTGDEAYGLVGCFVQAGGGGDVTVNLTGQSSTASAGTLGPQISLALSGEAGTFSAGTLVPSVSLALGGESATFAAGTVVPSVAIAAIGLQATFSPGTLTPSSSSGDTVALTGEAATFAQTAPSVNVTIALTGIAATMAAGILSASSGTATITVKAGSWLRYKKLQ